MRLHSLSMLLTAVTLLQATTGNEVDVPAEGAASLVFVFDVTGSMYDDLLQVIEGASRILATTLSRLEQPLHNYVLVPFRDPEIGPVTVTTDPDEFEDKLSYLYVQGGGDCPEMSIGAIKKALEVSLPRSYIYVFTDARAKDYHLTDEVISLIQRKESQVVFVMTGDCGDNEHEGFMSYLKIASTSSGQVFLLKKHQVNEVLNFVKIAISTRKVNLLSIDQETPAKNVFSLPVDNHLREFTISISGEDPFISIRDQDGNPPTDDQFTELLRLKNVYIVNVKDPKSGNWTLDISASSAHTLRITGISSLDFTQRFGVGDISTFDTAYARPVAGLPMYTYINGTGVEDGVVFHQIDFISLDGQTIRSLPLTLSDHPALYNTSFIMPPEGYFYIKVSGVDETGNPFIRSSKSAISAVIPERPIIDVTNYTLGHYGGSATLLCAIDSLIPFTVRWYRDNTPISPEQYFRQTESISITLSNLTLSEEGNYSCQAESDVGVGIGTGMVDVTDPPPYIRPAVNVTVAPGDKAILDCVIESNVEYDMRWYRVSTYSGRDIPLPAVMSMANGSLAITQVEENNEGWYVCEAENIGGKTRLQVFLKVGASPVVKLKPHQVDFVAGGETKLKCTAEASPPARIRWRRRGRELRSTDRIEVKDNELILRDMIRSDSGAYECVATNIAGTAVATSNVRYIEAPYIRLEKNSMLVAKGDSAALVCQATGIPSPTVTWYKNEKEINEGNAFVRVTASGELMILGAQPTDAADYTCVAKNSAGEDQANIKLEVGSVPIITSPPRSIQIDINSHLQMPCAASGYPQPGITWSRDGRPITELLTEPHITIDRNNSLNIRDIQKDDEGTYICTADNQFGSDEASASVIITGIIEPVIAFMSPLVEHTKGETMFLQCNVIVGNPKPVVSWYKNGEELSPIPGKSLIAPTGSLTVTDVDNSDEGEYMCKATNIGGTATMHTRLDVRVPPSIEGSGILETVERLQGTSVTLMCNSTGDPLPDITWSKNGNAISLSDPHYYVNIDNNLEIFTTARSDTAWYECKARNVVGEDVKRIQLTINEKPKIVPPRHGSEFTVVVGDKLVIPCDVTAYPPPTITWTHNGRVVEVVKPGYRQLDSGAYIITSVNSTDSGEWKCIATNEVGNTTTSLNVNVNVPPVIVDFGPTIHTVIRGEAVQLMCQADGTPPPTIRWQKNGNFLTTEDFSSGLTITADGSLYILESEIGDEGNYSCVASNDAGKVRKSIRLIIHDPPKWPVDFDVFDGPQEIHIIQGKFAKMLCPAQGFPKPKIIWYKDGRELTGNELSVNINDDGSLDIPVAAVSDSGRYTCRAENPAGDLTLDIDFSVYVPPTIGDPNLVDWREDGSLIAVINSTMILECPVQAIPQPTITWYRDGTLIEYEPGRVMLDNNGQILTVTLVTLSDEGVYKCLAENAAGTTDRIIDVDIHVPPSIALPPTSSADNITITQGRNLIVECAATGKPTPTITWFKNMELLDDSSDDVLVLDGGLRLLLTKPTPEHEGLYRCVADNPAGIIDKAFQITINIQPSIPESNEVSSHEVIRGDTIKLECPALGKPLPKITWLRAGEQVDPDLYPISEGGMILTVPLADVTDSGRYVCMAENVAGEKEKTFDLSVLVPPEFDMSATTTNVSAVQNQSVTLRCVADGDPYPDILWLRNNELLDDSNSLIEITSRGRQLQLHNIQVRDEGIYVCMASNKAGDKTVNITLNVLIPPTISTVALPKNSSVILGLQTAIDCPANGKPLPKITWYKNNVELDIASDPLLGLENSGRRLIIANTTLDSTATYVCRASNPAGRTEFTHELIVYVPPVITDSDTVTPLEVQVNDSITIQCDTEGIPRPLVTWLSNGQELNTRANVDWTVSPDGYRLTLVSAALTHTARYTCISTNEAGAAEKDFDLDVIEPPYIDDSSIEKDIRIIRGRQLTLYCPAMGTPYPNISWYRNGFPIDLELDERLSLETAGRQLSISDINVDDTGSYTCRAINKAGQAKLTINVLVLVPPIVDISNIVPRVRRRQNESVVIECPAKGIPDPDVSFLKNGVPLADLSAYSDGRIIKEPGIKRFVITSAQVSDSGRYTCLAVNEAGEARVTYDLQVHVPARVVREGLETDISVIENRTAVISCPVSGIPQPSIIWFRGRIPLLDWPYPNMRLLNQDQQLELSTVRMSQEDTYSCKVTNPAGRDRQQFHLTVLLPPDFEDDTTPFPEQLITVVKKGFSLSCPVTGEPKPEVKWYKDGEPISRDNFQYRISFDGELLDIISVEVEDAGRFTCEALNPAGKISKDFVLIVQVPSTIENSDGLSPISVIVGEPALLECAVDGEPSPDITWYKDGEVLDPRESSNIRVQDNGQLLRIIDAQLLDIGSYFCLATNPAGNATKAFSISVQVPPSIEPSDRFVAATSNTRTLLLCETQGLPNPSIRWYKDGSEVNPMANSRFRMLQSGSLEFSSVRPTDTGNYTCIATNEAGSANKSLTLSVQVPPYNTEPYKEISVNSGEDITLTCDVEGTPVPRVIWQIGTRIVANFPPEKLNKSLVIEKASNLDSGTYICIAQNPAGTATGRVKLLVLVAPVIEPSNPGYTVIEGRELQIPCRTQGVPRPQVLWSKNGEAIDPNDYRFRVLHDGRLAIPITRSEDEGMYTCQAVNEAGIALQDTRVNILVGARIVNYERTIEKIQGEVATLICEVEGIPAPTVTWKKNYVQINTESDPNYDILEDGSLLIQQVRATDYETFTCEAVNQAGQDSADMSLRVDVPPKIIIAPSETEVAEGSTIVMICEASGRPEPVITWQLNNTNIESPESRAGRSRLVIDNARITHTGTYKCIAKNPAGSVWQIAPAKVNIPPRLLVAPGNTAVRIADQVMLHCAVGGSPMPEILWTKDGKPVTISNRIQQLTNGSLVIKNSISDDGGEYKCVASNDAGTSEGVAYLIIRSPPTFKIAPPREVKVKLGRTIVIDCQAVGEPKPTVSWKRGNFNMTATGKDGRITQLQNNSLQIIAAQAEDSDKYMCHIFNKIGSAIEFVQISVLVDGRFSDWTDWGSCSVTCGYGIQLRTRTCTNPAPLNGGADCVGDMEDRKQCQPADCKVHGGYSEWLDWETCSATCGDAERVRRRFCDSPIPQHGGDDCEGTPIESDTCQLEPCPVNGNYTRWSPWQPCSVTCGPGFQERFRYCSAPEPAYGGLPCSGADTDRRICNNAECPIHGAWSSWQTWSHCTVSCGGGQRMRERLCDNPAPQNDGRPCIGFSEQSDYCNSEACPRHGGWSVWQDWGECSLPCNGGQKKRFRTCDNPTPSEDGRPCLGSDQDSDNCNTQQCPDGVWTSWNDWSLCSVSCGSGLQYRERACLQPLTGSQGCEGESDETRTCGAPVCKAPPPMMGAGNLIGEINGIEIDPIAMIDVLVNPALRGDQGTIVMSDISRLEPQLGSGMRLLSSLISSFYWTTAYEVGGAYNGYTLTDGFFRREAQVEFATGEIAKLVQVARGVDSSGTLQADIIVSGNLPEFPVSANIVLEPYIEDYIQTGPGRIFGSSARLFRVNGHLLPYAWNHTIVYNSETYSRMPHLVQRLVVRMPSADYNNNKQSLSFGLEAYIEPGEPSDRCPRGFLYEPSGPYCKDTDECSRLKPCSHECTNTAGGYRCSCPLGLTLNEDAKTCSDVDECNMGLARCHRSQECVNTIGSYKCVARCEKGFKRTTDGLACIDINECTQSDSVCDHSCKNLPGGYECRCRFGYRLYGRSRCIDIDECQRSSPPCSHQCENTPGGYRCLCPEGARLNSRGVCENINECREMLDNCGADEKCEDLSFAVGRFRCVKKCPPGLDLSADGQCVDTDECARNAHKCSYNQICNNMNGTYTCTCVKGYRTDGPGKPCVDYDECAQPGLCQYKCRNTDGAYKCLCPPGFSLHSSGRGCIDRDECSELNIRCGADQRCFNQRGTYQCIDTSCPDDYIRLDSGGCGLPCNRRPELQCLSDSMFADVIEFHTLAVPSGIPAYQDLLRLTAYNQNHEQLPNTDFFITENDLDSFEIRVENGRGIVSSIDDLRADTTYRITVRATSYDRTLTIVQYQTTFIIYISVSEYPF